MLRGTRWLLLSCSGATLCRWENPLMGWTSTADPLSYVGDHALNFDSKEAALDFCQRHGWQPTVTEPHQPVKKVRPAPAPCGAPYTDTSLHHRHTPQT